MMKLQKNSRLIKAGDGNWGSCGQEVAYVGPSRPFGVFKSRWECGKWSCQSCREKKIKEYYRKIEYLMQRFGGVQLFVGELKQTEKKLSNYILKNLKGLWVCIRSKESVVLISTRKFPGSARKDKRHYLKFELFEVLESPWDDGRRITFSSEASRFWGRTKESEGFNYASIHPVEKAEEYEKLRKDKDRAIWLNDRRLNGQKGFSLFKKGEEFIKKHIPELAEDSTLIVAGPEKQEGFINKEAVVWTHAEDDSLPWI